MIFFFRKKYLKLKKNNYTHLIYSGEGEGGLSHFELWIPIFKQANVKFMILVRNKKLYKKLIERWKEFDIIFAKSIKNVDFIVDKLPYLKVVFYPSNTGNVLHMLRFNQLKHIFIGHGDSDKTGSSHKYFRVYDENWVAGEAHIDRFRNAGFDFSGLKQVKVGRPNLKDVIQLSEINWKKRFNNKINLLYLSTWEGVFNEQDYTSIYIIQEFFKNDILNKFNKIDIKFHPWLGKRKKEILDLVTEIHFILEKKKIDYMIYDKSTPINKLIKNSNFFICDISAVVSECLAVDSPIFVYIPKDKEIKLAKSKMNYEDYTYTFSSLEELIQKINKVLVDDYLAENRKRAMEYILGKKETLNDEFIKQLKKI